MLLRSPDRGDHWTEISPDLSTNDKSRILPESEGGVPGGIPWFAITTISESPVTRGVIWAGTSDGKVQVTRNDGGAWTDVTAKIAAAGGRVDAYVSRVRASSHSAGRAYVSKSGYRFDDFKPYLYRTDDFGATWTSITATLPNEPINVVFEDAKNPDLLFVGNDTGVFVSIDRGARWVKMNNNMPNVPVHDLAVHPREQDLILGTYGRDFWITNVGALQELTDSVLASDAHLFSVKPTVQRITWSFGANDYLFGQRHLQTPNEPNGMLIRYYLKNAAPGGAAIAIANAAGEEVARLAGPGHRRYQHRRLECAGDGTRRRPRRRRAGRRRHTRRRQSRSTRAARRLHGVGDGGGQDAYHRRQDREDPGLVDRTDAHHHQIKK